MTCQNDFESHIRSLDGDYNLLKVGDIYIDVETQIEWRTWQKAWQAALASQQPADDGWIEWTGGACPVPHAKIVDVKFSGGHEMHSCRPSEFEWEWDDDIADIIAYRVVKP